MTVIKFGTDGWRDMMYDRFNLPNVRRVVQAIAKHVLDHHGEQRGLVVGCDARFFSDLFAREAAQVLMEHGIKVYLGERDYPTPVIAFAVKHYQAFGAIIFTASHNPPEYNGIKFIPEYAGPATAAITKEIEDNLELLDTGGLNNKVPVNTEGLLETVNPTEAYLEHLRSLVDIPKIADAELQIYVDPMYASGRGYVKQLLKGCKVTEIHSERDPLFGGSMPDPQAKFLGELIDLVKKDHNAIGLATDGDADRFGIIDSDGTYLTPNQVIALLLVHLAKNRGFKGVVGRTVATTHMIDRLGELFGAETIETPVGFKYIGELMRTKPVIIGGEESGGLSILGHIPEKDGILACALMAELRAVSGKPLLEILKELQQEVGNFYTRRIDLHLAEETKQLVLQKFKTVPPQQVGTMKVVELRTADGFKFILENGSWFLIRPSGTEPLIRIYFETLSMEELEILTENVQKIVNDWSQNA